MPAPPVSVSARHRHIGRVLRALREKSNLTQSRAGRLMGRSPSYLSLVEQGRSPLHIADLKHMLDVYGVPNGVPMRTALLTLCEQQWEGGWWDEYRDVVSPDGLDYASLEYHASSLFTFTTSVVPGLLQTPEYARSVVAWDFSKPSQQRNERFVSYRMARQTALSRDDAAFPLHFVFDEATLLQGFGGTDVQRRQLLHLLERSQDPRVSLRIIRTDCETHPGMTGSFTLLELGSPAVLSLVFVDHLRGRFTLERKEDIAPYVDLTEHLRKIALSREDSHALIESVLSGP